MVENVSTLNILTWNAQGIKNKKHLLQEAAAKDKLDIILLQETLLQEHHCFKFSGYKTYRRHFTQASTRGCMILVKSSIPSADVTQQFPCGENIETQAVKVTLQERELTVHNIYKNPRGSLEVTQLFASAADHATLIGGDFNAHHPFLSSVRPKNEDGLHLYTTFQDTPEICLLNTGEPTHTRGGRLDLTFVSSALQPSASWQIHPTLTSDHFATLTTLKVNKLPTPPPPRWRYNTQKADWGLFKKHLAKWREKSQPAGAAPADETTLHHQLVEAFHLAAEEAIPKTKPTSRQYNDYWYYCPRVKELNHRVNMARRNYRRHPTATNRHLLQVIVKDTREEKEEIKNVSWLKWCSELNEHTSLGKMWAQIRRASGKATPPPPTHPNPEEEAERLAKLFSDRAATKNLPRQAEETQRRLRQVRLQMIEEACNSEDDTDRPFNQQELQKSLKRSKDTAPGADRITYSMLSHAGTAGHEALLQAINASWTAQRLPPEWKKADIQPIPKPREPDKPRPISLLSCIAKTGERMALNRLKWKVGSPHPHIFAYTENTGTGNNIAEILSTVDNKPALVVFLDLEKAFELANPLAITTTLAKKGVKGRLLGWIQNYLTQREARVRFQGATSSYRVHENGTPQGGILSPMLFNVLMENLVKLPFRQTAKLLCYADDLQLIVRGSNRLANTQHALQLIEEECNRLGLKINPAKSKAMAICTDTPDKMLSIQNTPVVWTNAHQCLGIWFDQKLTFKPQLEYLRHRTKSRHNIMRSLTSKSAGANLHVLKAYYTAAIRSLVDYSAPALIGLREDQIAKLEVIQNNALRTMLGAPMWTRICNLQMETELPPLAVRVKQVTAGLLAKICRADKPTAAKIRISASLHLDHRVRGATWSHEASEVIRHLQAETLVKNNQDTRDNGYTVPPPWSPPPATLKFTDLGDSKANLQKEDLKKISLQAIATETPADAASYFTDGSVDPKHHRSGAAFYTQGQTLRWRLSNDCSTLQTELVAISKALQHAATQHNKSIIIHTDSKSAMQALQHSQPRDNVHIITSILAQLQEFQSQNRPVVLHWIPSHVGIGGNDVADEAAKAATRSSSVHIQVPASVQQIKNHLRKTTKLHIKKSFLHALNAGSQSAKWYLAATKGEPPFADKKTPRQTQVSLHRLRLGYKCSWQMIGNDVMECTYCQEPAANPLEHYLLDCEVTQSLRNRTQISQETHTTPAATLTRKAHTDHIHHLLRVITRYPPPR